MIENETCNFMWKADQGRAYAKPYDHIDKNKYIEIKPCSTFPEGATIVWAIGHLCALKTPECIKNLEGVEFRYTSNDSRKVWTSSSKGKSISF